MRLNGPFSSRIHNLLAAIVGLGVGVAGLYVSLWDVKGISMPFVSDQEDFYTVAGLQNLGNNCFLNVILQALASSSCFVPFLRSVLLSDDPLMEEKDGKMPLTVALSSLLEELCILRDDKSVLHPRRVMLAMSSYVDSFNLTRQQDAAEAFIHLLSALEEEILECYVPHDISLADIMAFPSKIYKPNKEGRNECKRWKKQFLGPFDGTVGSSLTCKSCSSMLSLDFQFFRCLPLSPVLDERAEIMAGCSVMDCLKHFTTVEHVDNYRCGRCWHTSALKYLYGKRKKDEEKIKKLEHCVDLDSCDCYRIFVQDEITWTGFSRASKQLSIARCPKILCIHLQRASMNEYGEFIKLQGHIWFPLFLDLFPFTRVNMGDETSEGCVEKLEKQQQNLLLPELYALQMKQEIHTLPHIYRIFNEQLPFENLSRDLLIRPTSDALEHSPNKTVTVDNDSDGATGNGMLSFDLQGPQSGSTIGGLNSKGKDGKVGSSNPSNECRYCLCSVVEHYGRPGSGHYAVYRRDRSEVGTGSSAGPSKVAKPRWFYISDHEVSMVPEEAVLAAEASLLFYELMDTQTT